MLKFIFNRFEEIIGTVCLAIMVTIDFINVLTRYVFKYSMAFTEELTLYLFVWVTMMGASLAFREGGNMAVSFLYDHFSRGTKKILILLSALISIVFFVVLGYYGILQIIDEIDFQAMTEAIELPMWWFTIAMPICAICTIIRIIFRSRYDFSELNKGEE